ncbi:MAG: DUF433 domain-containing protein [Acidimicrobiia bacterium]|nr:DUF433 domain-containing protein [Acidimicrobiia bacterium]
MVAYATMEPIKFPPVGYYLAHEVGQLAGVSGGRIGQWARYGYIRSSQSEGRPRVYSYQDVAEAMVVHSLINDGMPMSKIRVAVQNLRDEFGAWPLQDAPLYTESDRRILLQDSGQLYEADATKMPWHGVIYPVVQDHLKQIAHDLRRGGWAAREHPDLEYIEVDPERLSGRPTIKGRRIPARFVAETARAASGADLLREEFDLEQNQIDDAVRWLESVDSYLATAGVKPSHWPSWVSKGRRTSRSYAHWPNVVSHGCYLPPTMDSLVSVVR